MKILFLCTHNACRSILSEGITRAVAGDRLPAASAGTHPANAVHPLTLQHLERRGYDTGGLYSKSLDAVRSFQPDIVVTVCDSAAGESCPVWLGQAARVHWGLPDPSHCEGTEAERDDAFASVMTTIERRISHLLKQDFEAMDSGPLTALLQRIGKDS